MNGAERWGADEALDELYAAHWGQLVRLAVLLVHDVGTAEEVVQDSFVAMHRHWRRLRDPDRALPYLRQCVVNRARSQLRHRAVVERHARAEAARASREEAEDGASAAARRDAVLAALGRLPERQREVLVLRHYLDLSEADIATTLGISRGAVKSHAHRGSAALREHLADYWEDPS